MCLESAAVSQVLGIQTGRSSPIDVTPNPDSWQPGSAETTYRSLVQDLDAPQLFTTGFFPSAERSLTGLTGWSRTFFKGEHPGFSASLTINTKLYL